MVNYPALLLRKKSPLYPEGRTSYRFKRELRKKVTIIGKTVFGPNAKRPQNKTPQSKPGEKLNKETDD